MRILLFHFAELGSLGGVEVVVRGLAAAFKSQGCDIGIVQMSPDWKPQSRTDDDIPVWTLTSNSWLELKRPRSWASLARTTSQLRAVLYDFRPDILNVHFPVGQSMSAVAAHLLPHRWKLIVSVHGSDIRRAPYEDPRVKGWQATLFRRADAVTAVSHKLLMETIEAYPAAKCKGLVIENGVEPRWFAAFGEEVNSLPPYLLYVGRLHAIKGVDVLLRAWERVMSRVRDCELWLVGDGPEREALEYQALQAGLTPSVRFLGTKAREELPHLYRHAKVVVLPSRSEGMPMSLLEGGAVGALCVATRVGGIPEIIKDGETGFLVPPESVEELANALLLALNLDSDIAFETRRALQATVRARFSLPHSAAKYVQLFESLLPRALQTKTNVT